MAIVSTPKRFVVLCAATFALSTFLSIAEGQRIPANIEAKEYSVNGTEAGRTALASLGTSNATLINLIDYFLSAHDASEQTYLTANAGQKSGTVGAVAATGATLLASAVALNNASSARSEAQAALSAADSLVAAIVDENPLQYDDSTFANLLLTYSIAHDGTLVQFWQNMTAGAARDSLTLADTVAFAPTLAEAATEQLANGASPALVSIAAEIVARNILAAFAVYEGDFATANQQGLAEARLILKAVNVWQSNAACGGADASTYVSQVNTLVETATTASESLSPTDINAAKDAANAAVNSPLRCNAVSPALAPASAPASSTASLGRRKL